MITVDCLLFILITGAHVVGKYMNTVGILFLLEKLCCSPDILKPSEPNVSMLGFGKEVYVCLHRGAGLLLD